MITPSFNHRERATEIAVLVQATIFGFHSLIVAAALEAGCKTLFSEDLQHEQRIEQLTINNPFIER